VLLLFIGIISLALFGASVRHVLLAPESKLGGFGEALLKIAEFPSLARDVISGRGSTGQQIVDKRFNNLDGFKKNGDIPAGVLNDEGYLLLSSYDIDKNQSTVQLIQINNQEVLYEWVPDIEQLNKLNIPHEEYNTNYIAPSHFRLFHALLMKNGNLIFHAGGSGLYGITPCSESNMFVDGDFHHSNELDHEGNIWTPSVIYPHSYTQLEDFRDDAISKISPTGELLFKKSVAEILVENGYRGLFSVGNEHDPSHPNDIQPALMDSDYWKKGDLLLSLRNRSTVMLYRPSTNKILWLKTGPWMNQHDVNFVNDHTISIFGNNIIRNGEKRTLFDDNNSVYFYNFKTDKISEPYKNIIKIMQVRTLIEGRGTPLVGGDLFIDETTNGRILRVGKNKVKWEYVRRIDENTIAMSSWSRYLTREEVSPILIKLKGQSCK
jgi:hypothetical protein